MALPRTIAHTFAKLINEIFNDEDGYTNFYLVNNAFILPEKSSQFPKHGIQINDIPPTASLIMSLFGTAPWGNLISQTKVIGNTRIKDTISKIIITLKERNPFHKNTELPGTRLYLEYCAKTLEENESNESIASRLAQLIRDPYNPKKGCYFITNADSIKTVNGLKNLDILTTNLNVGNWDNVISFEINGSLNEDFLISLGSEVLCSLCSPTLKINEFDLPIIENTKLKYLTSSLEDNSQLLLNHLVYFGQQSQSKIKAEVFHKTQEISGTYTSYRKTDYTKLYDDSNQIDLEINLQPKDNSKYYLHYLKETLFYISENKDFLNRIALLAVKNQHNSKPEGQSLIVCYSIKNIMNINTDRATGGIRIKLTLKALNRQADPYGYGKVVREI